MAETPAPLPLAVDLDGTLLRTDLLVEGALTLLGRSPLNVFKLAQWALGGRASLKSKLAAEVPVDPAHLPFNDDVLAWVTEQKASGRKVVLATASHESLAKPLAAHLGLFDDVLATTDTHNLKGPAKAAALVAKFGEKGFTYAGDAPADLDVWSHAGGAVVVSGSRALQASAATCAPVEKTFEPPQPHLGTWVKALRLHQWLKNLLVFVPAFLAHTLATPLGILGSLHAFIAFGLCASSVYVWNDLLDLNADRQHRSKRRRPFASGLLSPVTGLLVAPAFLAAGLTIGFVTGLSFGLVLLAYFVTTTAYSFGLKKVALVDVLVLAGLYSVRIFAGATATRVPVSPWLLAFSTFLFLSLALVKRVGELRTADEGGSSLQGRGYRPSDLPVLSQMGVASGYLAILVLALYVQSPAVAQAYARPELLWLVCPPLLFWMSRVWLLVNRGEMHDDPVVFAARDRTSLVVVAVCVALVVAAT